MRERVNKRMNEPTISTKHTHTNNKSSKTPFVSIAGKMEPLSCKVAEILGDNLLLELHEKNEALKKENKTLKELKKFLDNRRFFFPVKFAKMAPDGRVSEVLFDNHFVKDETENSSEMWWDDLANPIALIDILDCIVIVNDSMTAGATMTKNFPCHEVTDKDHVTMRSENDEVLLELTLSKPASKMIFDDFEDIQGFDLEKLNGLFAKDIRCLVESFTKPGST